MLCKTGEMDCLLAIISHVLICVHELRFFSIFSSYLHSSRPFLCSEDFLLIQIGVIGQYTTRSSCSLLLCQQAVQQGMRLLKQEETMNRQNYLYFRIRQHSKYVTWAECEQLLPIILRQVAQQFPVRCTNKYITHQTRYYFYMVLGYLIDIDTAEGPKLKKIREMEEEFSA